MEEILWSFKCGLLYVCKLHSYSQWHRKVTLLYSSFAKKKKIQQIQTFLFKEDGLHATVLIFVTRDNTSIKRLPDKQQRLGIVARRKLVSSWIPKCFLSVPKLRLLTSSYMRTNASLLPGNSFQLTGFLLPAGSLRGWGSPNNAWSEGDIRGI